MEILQAKVGQFSLGKAALVGLAKVGSEKLISMTPVGNSSYVSAAAKLAGSYGLGKMAGDKDSKLAEGGRILATAMAVDGVEDAWVALFKGIGAGVPVLGSGSSNNDSNSGIMVI